MAMVNELIKALLEAPRNEVPDGETTQFEDFTWEVTTVKKPDALPPDVADLYYPLPGSLLTYERENDSHLKINVQGSHPRIENLMFSNTFEDVTDSDFISVDDEGDFEVKAVSFIKQDGGNTIMESIVIFKDYAGKLILGNWFCRTNP